MVFSSLNFLFLFLPCLIVFYFIIPQKFRLLRNNILLIFSLFFYIYGGAKFIIVMLFSISINYIFGLLVYKTENKRLFVVLAAVCNLSVLFYFKYTMFFLENINKLFNTNISIPNIVLPIGISFFTFQGLSYVLDIYNGNAQVQKNPLNVALYISLFPQLIAGPIVRYETVEHEIINRKENLSEFSDGIIKFSFGMGKKIILANSVGYIADKIFLFSPNEMTVSLAWIGAVCYTLQIYFDFSGYSDMAIGLGKMFGFHFLQNFNYPYISKSITDFWRRWHISLSTWFRDYVYIPLGGNRCSKYRNILNIFIVWLLTGFWHGAAWNFIFWGIYFAVLLMLEKFIYGKYIKKMYIPFQHLYALFFIIIGWVLFRSPSLEYAFKMIKLMLGFGNIPLFDKRTIFYLYEYKFELFISVLACIPLKNYIKLKPEFLYYFSEGIYSIFILLLSIMYLVNSTFNPFIYFRF